MRVTFLGNAAWSVPVLEALRLSRHQVALVVTRTPRPAGRGGRVAPTPVATAARRLGLPLAEVETVRSGSGFEVLVRSAPDALAVVAYGEILPPEVLGIPGVAPVNVHFSLLPELRGAAPVQRAILEGLARTGVSTIRMDEGLDTGPILLQAEAPIGEDDDAGPLGERLAALGGRVLVETLDGLEEGRIEERPQDQTRATYAPKLRPEDRAIDWAVPADHVVRRVRALAPDPGATTVFRGRMLKVLRASGAPPVAGGPPGPPGSVVEVSKEGLTVWAGGGAVSLQAVQPEGRRTMTGAEFVHGYRPQPGERLG